MKPTHIEHIGIAVKSLEEEQKKNAETVLTNTATWKLISEDASRKSVKDIGNILEQAKQLYDYLDGKDRIVGIYRS